MCNPMAATAVLTMASTVMQARAQRKEGQFKKGVADYNSRVISNEAEKVRTVGNEAENVKRRQTAELLSKQRAQLGASGVDINSGSAAQLQESTVSLGEADALRIRSNFDSKVNALKTQSSLLTDQGNFAQQAGRNASTATILGGAAKVAGTGVADKWFTPDSAAVAGVNTSGFANA